MTDNLNKLIMMLETTRDVIETAWNEKVIKAEPDLVDSRCRTCELCEEFIDSKRKCRICSCYMDIKMQLKAAKCPIDKW